MTGHEKIAREIKDFLVDKGLTMTDVAARLGCSQQAVSNQLSGRKMGQNVARKWAEAFGFDLVYLMTGEGSLFAKGEQPAIQSVSNEPDTVPLLPIFAQAGSLSGWSEGIEEVKCERVISPVKDVDMAVHIYGESMSPDIPNGAVCYVRRVTGRVIDYGRAYILDTVDGPLYIEDIDRVWLHAFDASIGGKVNSRGIHLRNLRAICNFALDEELTTHYPFRKFKIRTEETRKKALTLEQVRAYLAVPGPNEYRDVFVLMIYLRGINISDLAELTEADVVNGRIEYRRNKTGQLYSIRVEPEAQEILDRWKGEGHLLAVFDRYRNPRDYNRRLREALKRMAGPDGRPIERDCSSNWARHTWATMCAELDVPDPTISLGMGHRIAGHRTTAIYIKRDQRKVDEANRKVIDYIKESVPHLSTQDGLD